MSGKISVISFSEHGFKFQDSLKSDIEQWAVLQEMETAWYCKDRCGFGVDGYTPVMVPTKEWSANRFEDSDIIVYFCTVAKAVRNFAPSMKGQTEDPAIVAIDQQGRYCVPVLSGKKGEAYELCLWLEQKTGITAVNSGGTPLEDSFSVTKFAEEQNMVISNASYAKEIKAALESGEKIGFYTIFPVKGDLPEGMEWSEKGPLGINLSPSYQNAYFAHTLWLIPKCIEIGILLREEVTPRDIQQSVNDMLKELSIYPESICCVNVVENEYLPVAKLVCVTNDYPLKACPVNELEELQEMFHGMSLTDCAVLKNGASSILARKTTENGIELSVALKKIYVEFS